MLQLESPMVPCLSIPVVLDWRCFCWQGTLGNVQRHLHVMTGGALMTSSEQRPRALLKIPQCTRQPPSRKHCLDQNGNNVEIEKLQYRDSQFWYKPSISLGAHFLVLYTPQEVDFLSFLTWKEMFSPPVRAQQDRVDLRERSE